MTFQFYLFYKTYNVGTMLVLFKIGYKNIM
jgi:hypothetical protein